ncbi:MAG: AraC family transcriptional regulator [Terracidiphilus sp.]|jgi:AraC-like DNA-binding protein
MSRQWQCTWESNTDPSDNADLADLAKMIVSTFHEHFRTLTQKSPLRYQKQIRLYMARVRMLTKGLDAANAAFEVGFESASRFNRECRSSW